MPSEDCDLGVAVMVAGTGVGIDVDRFVFEAAPAVALLD